MKVLILANEEHDTWIWYEVLKYFGSHDIHIYRQKSPYPFEGVDYDIGISFMYLHKVPSEQIKAHTWINFHPAPLPAYKGRNLCYHAIMNGEKKFGATIHYMDENFDTGDIIEVHEFDIFDWNTAGDLSKGAMLASQHLFEKYMPRILSREEFARIPNVGGTYYKKEPISDYVQIGSDAEKQIRAITCGKFYPIIKIGGVTYKIVKNERDE